MYNGLHVHVDTVVLMEVIVLQYMYMYMSDVYVEREGRGGTELCPTVLKTPHHYMTQHMYVCMHGQYTQVYCIEVVYTSITFVTAEKNVVCVYVCVCTCVCVCVCRLVRLHSTLPVNWAILRL